MKETIRNILLYMLVFYFVVTLFSGIILPTNLAYVFATLLILALAMMIAKPFLNFLTIKANFLTMFLVGSILVFGAIFLLETLMPGFAVETTKVVGVNFGSVVIKDFEMIPMVTMAVVAASGSLICSIFHELD